MVNKSREKESDRETNDLKKHRKTATTNSNDAPPAKIVKEDVYASVINFEEEESKKRAADKDSSLYLQTCEKIKKIFLEIAQLKTQNTPKAQEEIKARRIKGSFLFAILKKLNRLDKVRLRAGRDALHKEKLTVDSNKLQLQNLLYEADHLRKEVQHCLQFKSHDEEIDLVDEAKFYEEAPESITRRDKTENDDHARRLARLEWELHQRKELAAMCKSLQTAKEAVALEIETKTNRLQSLVPCLDQLLAATRPLQEALGVNVEKEWAVQQIAKLLPRPLYVAYVNLSAYAEISNKIVDTSIVGDEEEAKELENNDKTNGSNDADQDTTQDQQLDSQTKNDNDDDDDDQENDGQHSSKKHHHRRQQSTVNAKVNVFKPHPLSVTFKLPPSTPNGPSLLITLYYLPALRFVTVQTKLVDFDADGIAARDVLDPNKILNCLLANDCDENEILHPKTAYTLHHLSIDAPTFFTKLGEHQLGKPFTWVQNICGLNFIGSMKSVPTTQETVPVVIDKMHNRLRSRHQLYRQILSLEKKTYDELIEPTSALANIKVTCILAQWSPITFKEYTERLPLTSKFIDENLVTENHLLYHAVIIRASAKMDCFISVSPNFPNECPIWAISLNFNSSHLNTANSLDIREMELWINSIDSFKRSASNILVLQLKRAMSSLDVYLETEFLRLSANGTQSTLFPAEFKAEKTFLAVFRSRTRSRPYKLVRTSGSTIYTQINTN